MIHIIPIGKLRTIFGHNLASDNFWTEICLTSVTSNGPDRFSSETGTTITRTPLGEIDSNPSEIFSVAQNDGRYRRETFSVKLSADIDVNSKCLIWHHSDAFHQIFRRKKSRNF